MSAYSDAVLATANLVAYWRLGEPSGSGAVDANGTQDGVYVAGTTLGQPGALAASGDADTAVLFNGTAGRVTLVSNAALDTMGDITAEAWIKLDATPGTDRIIFGFHNAASTAGWALGYNESGATGTLSYFSGLHGAPVWKQSTATINDTAWHQVVVTVASTLVSFYVDGSPAGTATGSRPNTYTGARALGSNNSPGDFWDGQLDEVSYYTRALTPAEILQHYNAAGTDVNTPGFQAIPFMGR